MQEQLEAALELTRQQLGQTTREAAAPGRAWGHQRLLQDRLVSVRAALCHLTQVSVWEGAYLLGDPRTLQVVTKGNFPPKTLGKVVLETPLRLKPMILPVLEGAAQAAKKQQYLI